MPIVIFGGTDQELEAGRGKRMLTRTQAAARLGVTERRVTHFVAEGEITPFEEKLFHVPLFESDAIEKFRESRLKRY